MLWVSFCAMTTARCFIVAGSVAVATGNRTGTRRYAPLLHRSKIEIYSASPYPAEDFHSQNRLEAFAKDLAEATDGTLTIRVYPNASLLPASPIERVMQIGQAQNGRNPNFAGVATKNSVLGIDVVPFLATSYDEARKLWAASKPLIERKLAGQLSSWRSLPCRGHRRASSPIKKSIRSPT